MGTKPKVPSFPAAKLHEFLMLELGDDISGLPKNIQSKIYGLNHQEKIFFYTADELLLACDSHLRFFEDWLHEQQTD